MENLPVTSKTSQLLENLTKMANNKNVDQAYSLKNVFPRPLQCLGLLFSAPEPRGVRVGIEVFWDPLGTAEKKQDQSCSTCF